jgi:hypothetical protein
LRVPLIPNPFSHASGEKGENRGGDVPLSACVGEGQLNIVEQGEGKQISFNGSYMLFGSY